MSQIYSFYYPEYGVYQEKILISHNDYLTVKVLPEDSGKEEKRKDKALKILTKGKQWFTDKSPLYDAIITQVLQCNGIHLIEIKLKL